MATAKRHRVRLKGVSWVGLFEGYSGGFAKYYRIHCGYSIPLEMYQVGTPGRGIRCVRRGSVW